jgi:DNA-binding NtrC family response regulator
MQADNRIRLRILAVDDEQIMLDLYRDAFFLLADRGEVDYRFEVVLCKQADEAVDAARKAKDEEEPFAIAFLDLRLPPGPDGIWAGEQIRKLDPFANFVIVTGFFDVDPREIATRIPPEDKLLYVQKPLHIREILQFAISLGQNGIQNNSSSRPNRNWRMRMSSCLKLTMHYRSWPEIWNECALNPKSGYSGKQAQLSCRS